MVSDHGFLALTHSVNLFIPFLEAGLIQADTTSKTTVIKSWKAQPWMAGGMAAIMRGGLPDAALLVVLTQGYYTAPGTSGALVTLTPGTRDSHGFSPEFPEMHSSFFAIGAGVAQHRDLGQIDIRQIAPTIAGILSVQLPSAKTARLNVAP